MNRGIVVGTLAALLLGGCGDQASGSGSDLPTSVSAVTTVLDDGDGPELCLGDMAWTTPPECSGPKVLGWNWADHPDHESSDGVRWGSFAVTGQWDGAALTVTEARPATDDDVARAEPVLTTPCDEPAGGWAVIDPETTTMSSRSALTRAAEAREDYGLVWVDQSINPVWSRIQGGEQSLELEQAMNDPKLMIVNVGVTGDPAAAEADLRPLWGGPLCVHRLANTLERLREVSKEVEDLPGHISGQFGTVSNVVEVTVVFDDGSIQESVDETFGEGVVEITSALVPVEG